MVECVCAFTAATRTRILDVEEGVLQRRSEAHTEAHVYMLMCMHAPANNTCTGYHSDRGPPPPAQGHRRHATQMEAYLLCLQGLNPKP